MVTKKGREEYNPWRKYLTDLDDDSKKLSETINELLYQEVIEWSRFDKERKELVIHFRSGRRLFIDNIHDKYDISIT